MKTAKNVFWNAREKRVRAGWRLLIQLILFLLIVVGMAILANTFGSGPVMATTGSLIYLVGGLGLAWLMARFIDHRPFADFGFHWNRTWWLDLGFGSALGAFLMTAVFLSMKAAGWVSVTRTATTNSGLPFGWAFLLKVVVYVAIGVNEELTFRGYQLKNLSEGLTGKRIGPRVAIVLAFLISSAAFSLGHITNAGATVLSTLNLLVAGLSLGLPYMLTGELAISVGLHITWNLFEATVYGFPVSGSSPTTHLFSSQQTGPVVWTGGAFGPEAGLLSMCWTLVGVGLTVLWIRCRRERLGLHTPLVTYMSRSRSDL